MENAASKSSLLLYCRPINAFKLPLKNPVPITAVAEGGLGVERTDAAVMAANLTAYTYMAPLIGGIICDRWLGARYAITLGYIIMALGYVVGWKAQSPANRTARTAQKMQIQVTDLCLCPSHFASIFLCCILLRQVCI